MVNLGATPLGGLADAGAPGPTRPSDAGPARPFAGRGADPASREERAHAPGAAALARLVEETVTLFRRLRAAAEELHGREAPSGGRRAVLRDLARLGPRTVPQLARARSVTRQHVQALVNPLVEAGYVELLENPAHKRSRLVGLTARGREFVAAMNQRESEALSGLDVAASEVELERAADALRSVREALEER